MNQNIIMMYRTWCYIISENNLLKEKFEPMFKGSKTKNVNDEFYVILKG